MADRASLGDSRHLSAFVGGNQLTAFLASVGARSVGLASAAGQLFRVRLAALGRHVAGTVSGAVVLHDAANDPNEPVARAAWRLLAGFAPEAHTAGRYLTVTPVASATTAVGRPSVTDRGVRSARSHGFRPIRPAVGSRPDADCRLWALGRW